MKNFAVTGVAGFVAPRHLQAIQATGNRVAAAVDPHDAVGILDRYSLDVAFFSEFERFDRHVEKARRGPEADRIHYVSICSPNHLHDAHIRFALRVGADAICEKPLVIKPWNLDALQDLERETGRRVNTVLQLRLHPALIELRDRLMRQPDRRHDVVLTYVTGRGRWYAVSWKGQEERSGGLVTNIGIHLFDLVIWLFGGVRRSQVHVRSASRAAGLLELERADIRWYLSSEIGDVPADPGGGPRKMSHRSMTIDGDEINFTDGFVDLHTRVYERVLAGEGFGIDEARPAVEAAYRIRTADVAPTFDACHPWIGALVQR